MAAKKKKPESPKTEEIEITPEMIDAGAHAVARGIAPSRLYAPMDEETLAILVFEAMLGARQRR